MVADAHRRDQLSSHSRSLRPPSPHAHQRAELLLSPKATADLSLPLLLSFSLLSASPPHAFFTRAYVLFFFLPLPPVPRAQLASHGKLVFFFVVPFSGMLIFSYVGSFFSEFEFSGRRR